MSPANPPQVRIENADGIPSNTNVTVDGVPIFCTKMTWTADCADGRPAQLVLEVPRVAIRVEQAEVIARYVAHKSSFPWFWWSCPCGMEMAYADVETAAASFRDPTKHIVGCTALLADAVADGGENSER